jgi:hypothetical protein
MTVIGGGENRTDNGKGAQEYGWKDTDGFGLFSSRDASLRSG